MASGKTFLWEYKSPVTDLIEGTDLNPFFQFIVGSHLTEPTFSSSSKIVAPWENADAQGDPIDGTVIFHGKHLKVGQETASGRLESITLKVDQHPVFEVTFNKGISMSAMVNAFLASDGPDQSPLVAFFSKAPSEFSGSSGDDAAFLFNAKDILHGNGGNDDLHGGGGRDKLFGDGGSDRLDGEQGGDQLTGGKGPDVFVFSDGGGHDKILDFSGKDSLDLTGVTTVHSVDDVLSHAKFKGGDVRIDFGNGDVLKIPDVSKADLLDHLLVA